MGRPAFLDDHRLRAFVDRARIDCENLFEYACPMYWGGLQRTSDPAIRHCRACRQDVYFTSTLDELVARSQAGQCVAIMMDSEVPNPDDLPEVEHHAPPVIMGQLAPIRDSENVLSAPNVLIPGVPASGARNNDPD